MINSVVTLSVFYFYFLHVVCMSFLTGSESICVPLMVLITLSAFNKQLMVA